MENQKTTPLRGAEIRGTEVRGPEIRGTDVRPAIAPVPGREIERSSISWRAIFAGFFVSLLVYMILFSLGIAVGGATLQGTIDTGAGGSALSIGSGIWLLVSAIISLFVGGYVSGRVAGFVSRPIGGAQGLVVAALFFFAMLSQVGATLGSVGGGIGSLIGSAGSAAGDLAKNPQVQATVENALGDLNLKSPPDQVMQGVATRMIRGDTDGARNYLARQAGITPEEATTRINGFTEQFQATLKDVGSKAASVLSVVGWTLFGSLLLGSLAGLVGGLTGCRLVYRRYLSTAEDRSDRIRAA